MWSFRWTIIFDWFLEPVYKLPYQVVSEEEPQQPASRSGSDQASSNPQESSTDRQSYRSSGKRCSIKDLITQLIISQRLYDLYDVIELIFMILHTLHNSVLFYFQAALTLNRKKLTSIRMDYQSVNFSLNYEQFIREESLLVLKEKELLSTLASLGGILRHEQVVAITLRSCTIFVPIIFYVAPKIRYKFFYNLREKFHLLKFLSRPTEEARYVASKVHHLIESIVESYRQFDYELHSNLQEFSNGTNLTCLYRLTLTENTNDNYDYNYELQKRQVNEYLFQDGDWDHQDRAHIFKIHGTSKLAALELQLSSRSWVESLERQYRDFMRSLDTLELGDAKLTEVNWPENRNIKWLRRIRLVAIISYYICMCVGVSALLSCFYFMINLNRRARARNANGNGFNQMEIEGIISLLFLFFFGSKWIIDCSYILIVVLVDQTVLLISIKRKCTQFFATVDNLRSFQISYGSLKPIDDTLIPWSSSSHRKNNGNKFKLLTPSNGDSYLYERRSDLIEANEIRLKCDTDRKAMELYMAYRSYSAFLKENLPVTEFNFSLVTTANLIQISIIIVFNEGRRSSSLIETIIITTSLLLILFIIMIIASETDIRFSRLKAKSWFVIGSSMMVVNHESGTGNDSRWNTRSQLVEGAKIAHYGVSANSSWVNRCPIEHVDIDFAVSEHTLHLWRRLVSDMQAEKEATSIRYFGFIPINYTNFVRFIYILCWITTFMQSDLH